MKKVAFLIAIAVMATTTGFATLSPLCKGCRKTETELEVLRRTQRDKYITDVEILTNLDKQGRQMYRSLDKEGQELARRIVTLRNDKDYKNAVVLAAQEREKQRTSY